MIKPRLWIISLYVAGSTDLASSVIDKILLYFFQSLTYDIITISHGHTPDIFLIPILLLLLFIMVKRAIYLYSFKATRTMKTNYKNIWRVKLVPSSLRVAVPLPPPFPPHTHAHAHTHTWSVVPPMWQAAAPVLADIEVLCDGNIVIKRFKRYDLPVLALPVKNTLFPALMAFITVICSGIRFISKELKELRRLLAGPLCSSSPQFESLSLPIVLNSFGVIPFLSSRGLFLQPTVKSLSVRGLMFSNDCASSLRSRLLLLAIPFCLLWASFNDRHFKNVASWFGGQFRNIIWIFCVRGLMVAFPSCKNRLWMVNSFRRKVFPNGDWLLTMSRNSSRPKTAVILLKVHRFVTTPLELRFSTVKQRSNSLASIALSK